MKNIHIGYSVLEAKVLPVLKSFQDDVKVHDKRRLVNYKGDFISMYRSTGSNLLLLDSIADYAKWSYKNPLESILMTHDLLIEYVRINQFFLYVKADGSSYKISRENVLKKIEERREKAIKYYNDTFKKVNFYQIAEKISSFIKKYGKRWRSKLQNEEMKKIFDSDVLKRIRNDFSEDKIRTALIESFIKDK